MKPASATFWPLPLAMRAAVVLLPVFGALAAQDDDGTGHRPGGETTVEANGRNAFSMPAANLGDTERARFAIGNSFFRRNWVEAPASASVRDGLGPHFIARSCGGCHSNDGRGAPPDFRRGLARQPVALLIRLSIPGEGPHGEPVPEPVYGDQFTNSAITGVRPEGRVTLRWQPVRGRFADGVGYTLQRPLYGFSQLAYGPMAKNTRISPRIAPQLIGVGLIEAIADGDIQANAEAQGRRSDGIRGKVNRVWDAPSQQWRLGRFGWKANVATLAHQTASAFAGDMGITSSLFPEEACTAAQTDCLNAPRGGKLGAGGRSPEIDDETLGHVVFYQSVLAPPVRRDGSAPQVLQGQKLFQQAQCAVCHRPRYTTAQAPFARLSSAALNGQAIYPFTDLLLHDMGEALADGRPDYLASGRQWKTPPLWGIGLLPGVSDHQRLLHDGRARGVLEAVLWHGGEAQASRDQVLKMSRNERAALVRFVESL